jgi:excisionase family DNA binding protein
MTGRRCCNEVRPTEGRPPRPPVSEPTTTRARRGEHIVRFGRRAQAFVDANERDAKERVVDTGDRLLTPGEVAALFRVDPKTVTRWAAAGRISSIRTPGGHRRFRESEVRALLEGDEELPGEGGDAEPRGR